MTDAPRPFEKAPWDVAVPAVPWFVVASERVMLWPGDTAEGPVSEVTARSGAPADIATIRELVLLLSLLSATAPLASATAIMQYVPAAAEEGTVTVVLTGPEVIPDPSDGTDRCPR